MSVRVRPRVQTPVFRAGDDNPGESKISQSEAIHVTAKAFARVAQRKSARLSSGRSRYRNSLWALIRLYLVKRFTYGGYCIMVITLDCGSGNESSILSSHPKVMCDTCGAQSLIVGHAPRCDTTDGLMQDAESLYVRLPFFYLRGCIPKVVEHASLAQRIMRRTTDAKIGSSNLSRGTHSFLPGLTSEKACDKTKT